MDVKICMILALVAMTKAYNLGHRAKRDTEFDYSCSPGFDLMGTECFRYYVDEEKFSDASAICFISNGNLVSIESEDMKNKLVDKYIKVNTKSVWIGYTDANSEGTWRWVDGTTSSYENWQSVPTANTGKNCAVMVYDVSLKGQWIDDDCSLTKPFICKAPATKTPKPPAPTPSPSGACTGEWKQFGTTCYRLTRGLKPWDKAQKFCEFLGGTLATINSAEVQKFLQDNYMKPTAHGMWIGLNSQAVSGTWKWKETDQVPTYTNWAVIKGVQQPENVTEKRCVATENYRRKQMGKWNDIKCRARYWSICQKPTST